MSASKQKKLRSNSDAPDRKAIEAQEKAAKDKKFRRNAVIFIVVFAILVAAALVINSNFFYRNLAAAEVNGTNYSATELSFYYNTAYNQFYNEYGDYISYMLDTSTPLSEQECSLTDGGTWADYFLEQALLMMEETESLYTAAIADGYSIDDEITSVAQANLDYMGAYAVYQGFENNDAYLAYTYGKGMDSEEYIEIASKYLLASKYAEDNYNSYEYSDEELDAYYDENANSYDTFTYNLYYIAASNEAYAEHETEEEKFEAARADAEKLAAAATEEEFNAIAAELSGKETEDTQTSVMGGNLTSYYSEWITDAARVEGETNISESDSGIYVVRFISREDCRYNTVDVRHILIMAEANDSNEITEEALAVAKTEAEKLYAEWQLNPTEENFIALANEHSDDSAADGLYEKVYKNQMVEEFDAFCFDAHLPGDTAIVYGNNGSYEGYHIVYYVGQNDLYSRIIADSWLRNDDYSAFVEAATAGGTSELKWASRFAAID